MAIGYRIFVFILLCFFVGRKISLRKCFKCNRDTTDHTSWWERNDVQPFTLYNSFWSSSAC